MRGAIEQGLVKVIGNIKPALKDSQFLTQGVLTPEEFVQAGDLLVYKCPAWKWEGGDPKKAVSYLPRDKQYLMTRGCPCSVRAADLEQQAQRRAYRAVDIEGDEGWVCDEQGGSAANAGKEEESIPDVDANNNNNNNGNNNNDDDDDNDDDDVPDMEDYSNEDNVDEAAVAAAAAEKNDDKNSNVVGTRTYDIAITYDNYYNTPKMWLFGYSETGQPLTAAQIFQDISEDHARKTVTIDLLPHLPDRQFAFIHPCKHSAVIKSLLDRMVANGHEPRVDHYLFIFLKFMSAVIPTIEYDLSPEMTI